jgi:hypothetical protein
MTWLATGHNAGRQVPVHRRLIDVQQVGQANAGVGRHTPRQLVRRQVDDERHLHHLHIGGGVQGGAKRVRPKEERLVRPQARSLVAARRDSP